MKDIVIAGRAIHVWREGGHWAVSVDGRTHPDWFMSAAKAAGAGLLEAYAVARPHGRRAAPAPRDQGIPHRSGGRGARARDLSRRVKVAG